MKRVFIFSSTPCELNRVNIKVLASFSYLYEKVKFKLLDIVLISKTATWKTFHRNSIVVQL